MWIAKMAFYLFLFVCLALPSFGSCLIDSMPAWHGVGRGIPLMPVAVPAAILKKSARWFCSWRRSVLSSVW